MQVRKSAAIVSIAMLALVVLSAFSAATTIGPTRPLADDGGRDGVEHHEVGDESHNNRDAVELESDDVYFGHMDRVGDRSDHFEVTVAQHQVVNVHIRVMGHDGIDEWVRPTATTPPSPPDPITASCMFNTFIYHQPTSDYPLDGVFNYYYIRDYVLSICAPVPGTHTYSVNVSLDWWWTPNNYTWDYRLDLDISSVPELTPGNPITGTIDLATRDTMWYKVRAWDEQEINGSFEVLNFNSADPEERNIDMWVFPDDLGGYPRSIAWDWSAAPNEPIEPFSILSTYSGFYYIKLRGMNHDNTLPCTYRLEVYTSAVPEFPEDGVQGVYFDRYRHDTDWYRFDMGANQLSDDKPGLWNDMRLFNMTERADAEDLPDFDLYLFGRVPGYRSLDLLDSSFRSDHATFLDPVRDPNRNTEEVHAAAFYNGTYYLEVNAYNNTGYYDVRMETPDMILSDDDNLPVRATGISSGVYESYIHQAFDHYDWYKVKALDDLRVQFDSFKGTDTFNLSIYRWDALDERFELITGDWNTRFNLTSREDQISHLIDVTIRLADFGLGAGTYYIAVFAAVASDIAVDSVSGRPYSYVTDGNAEAHYELRVWSDYVPPTPVELIRIPPVQVEEGTNLLEHVDLHDHFVSRNVGDSLRFKATVTSGKVSELVLMDDILGVVADDDYVGWVRIKVSAISEDYLTHSQNWNIEYTSVNDAPRLVDPSTAISFEMPEDSIRALDLSQIFWDVDRGDRLAITVDPSDHLTIEVDPETLVANITSAPDWFGTETVTIVATDTEGASIEVPIEIVVVNVQDAPVMLREIGTITMDEDTIFDQDLSQYLYDADGDELEVFISADTYIGHTYDAATNMMTLEPILNYHGYRVLWLTAMDSTGNRVQMQFWLEVVAVPDPPKIVLWSPVDLAVTVREGGQLTMTALQTMDPDSSVLFFRWYLDGSFVGPSISYTYKPGINDQGAHEVTVEVEDETGLKDSVTWTVTVEDVSHPPEGGIATPGQDGRFREGEPITFIAMFYDPDSEDLDYKWFINGDEVSSDPAFEKALDDGDHKITLLVSSNGDAVTQEVDISVEERSADTGWVVTGIAAMAALAIVVVAIAIARRSRS